MLEALSYRVHTVLNGSDIRFGPSGRGIGPPSSPDRCAST
jgi:hypothetical protein